ncbi:MAG: hypothetical protein HXY40_05620 [Chloroflexi bacterium]|nr:hypothetical protein [Chloroflexota bacterium]
MIDPSKPIKAADLLNDLDAIYDIGQNYILLSDSSLNESFLKMIALINLLDERSWEVAGISHSGNGMTMYTMMRRITKAKN